ncbi:MAG: class I SAM-dependent RNA methyltransferase [Rhodospirillaceae bacterium]|jgi:23S rRNA (uracil1939-C5)-methyltransferase|nr:class I SAM-dependent RNA methyltransferase [Rhodospirillaceae bacterium]MBT4588498.1 class I SAM-dependent RNA methyltransferase [Rhodospirillaceae bacterium]MBT4938199.1 class I SAM-dependent RNA methyltransferase [Rhodospirillaceae bacterium]MBT7266388.1 class I SAM-dependent RNA methyltransferase [Rhodospirillaceae bacterium]
MVRDNRHKRRGKNPGRKRGNEARGSRDKTYTPQAKTLETVEISELGRRGDGIATVEGGEKRFVPYTLAGETVEIESAGNRSELKTIKTASPDRTQPFCPHFTICGGCAVQHASPLLYQSWKRGIVETALANKGLSTEIDPLVDAHGQGRRRVTFHAKRERDQIQAGLMKYHSHRILDLDACPVLTSDLAPALEIARAFAAFVPTRSKPLDIQFTATENGLDCNIRGASVEGSELFSEIVELADQHNLARVTFGSGATREVILERQAPTISVGDVKVTLPPASFLQATQDGEEVLASLVLEHLEEATNIADLYCGIGPFALRLAKHAAISAYDNDSTSIAALTNAYNHVQGLKPLTAFERDLSEDPLLPQELNKFDAAIFDPPRAGAPAQAEQLAASTIKTIVGVSCDPASFAKDAATLVEAGFTLQCVTPIDQFKYTAHVELVALFERK